MHQLTMRVDPYGTDHRITLDGKDVSIYSEFSNFLTEPVLEWAYRFFQVAEREINDAFSLTVMGNAFAQRLFRGLKTGLCHQVQGVPLPLPQTSAQRMELAMELARQHQVDLTQCLTPYPVYSREDTGREQPPVAFVEAEKAQLLLVESARQLPEAVAGKKLAIVTEPVAAGYVEYRQGLYVFYLPEEEQADCVAEIMDGFCFGQWVKQAAEKLAQVPGMETLTAVKPVITLAPVPDVPLEGQVEIPYRCYPADARVAVTAVPVVPGILEARRGTLLGIGEGCTDVEFFLEGEPKALGRQQVRVFRENFAKEIRPEGLGQLTVGQEAQLQIWQDGEEALTFRAAPEGILGVEEGGLVRALAPGEAVITIAGARAQAQVTVSVVPAVEGLRLTAEHVACFVGETFPIAVGIAPPEAPAPNCLWRSGNSRVAVVETTEDGALQIRAVGVGQTQILCSTEDGACQAVCQVQVNSTFEKHAQGEKNNLLLFGAVAAAVVFALMGRHGLQVLAAVLAMAQMGRMERAQPWIQGGAWLALGHGIVQLVIGLIR